MEPMNTFRCADGDYLLMPPSSMVAPGDAAGAPQLLLGRVTCSHLDPDVQQDIAQQLAVRGFARITREKFFAPAAPS